MIKTNLTIKEASEFMGWSEQRLRMFLQKDPEHKLGIAYSIILKNKPKKIKFYYHIPIRKIESYMNMSYEEYMKNKEK